MGIPDLLALAAPYPYFGMKRDDVVSQTIAHNTFFQTLVDWYHNSKLEPVWDGKIWYPLGHDCRPQDQTWDGKPWYPLPNKTA